MASSNTDSLCYIADAGEQTKTYMDIELGITPYPCAPRVVSAKQCIPGSANGGTLQINDFGISDSMRVLEFTVPWAELTTVQAIDALYAARDQVMVSFDDGATKYLCSWQNGKSFEVIPEPGLDVYVINFKLHVCSVTLPEAPQ